jgi:hypothetical protein
VYPTPDETGQLAGGLRTEDGVSEVVTSELVLGSIIMFGLIYALLFALWVFLLDRAIRKGPGPSEAAPAAPTDGDAMLAITARAAHRDEDEVPPVG